MANDQLVSGSGPFLSAFSNETGQIVFKRLLSDNARHSKIFEVGIGQQQFALKVVRVKSLEIENDR